MSIYRGAGGASDATNDATVNAVAGYASAAASSATNAATSAANAATSADAANTSVTSATTQASNAATSASNAASSASSAAGSVTSAATQASNAATSASNASTSASNASTSASSASTSATASASSASASSTSAGTATTKATEAAASAASALAIYGNTTAMNAAVTASQTAASNAATSASSAATSAASALVYKDAAAVSASNASTSASASASSASTAAGSVATIAGYSASANTAATNAGNSATAAASSASSAAISATTASTNATTSTTQANSAAASAAIATTKASEASISAANASNDSAIAANSASSADTSANNAAASAAYAATTVAGFDGNVASAITSAANASASASAAATSANNASTSATQAAASAAGATAIVTGVASTRPSIRPSLLLDFANTRVLDPRITFTRASTATFYDNETSAVAEQNLSTYSQDYTNAAWTATGAIVTANTTTAPNGTTTATTLTESATTADHRIYKTSQYVSDFVAPYTVSVFVKANTRTIAYLYNGSGAGGAVFFNLSTVAVGSNTNSASISNAVITSVGNSWYRISALFANGGGSGRQISFGLTSTDGVTSYAGDGVSDIYAWGFQVEQRSAVTAYTPTTTAAITNYIPVLQTAASGAARFDCNPVTRESLGLLIEESRTNLLTYSSEFDNASWTKTASAITANTIISPDGALTGDKVVENSTPSVHTAEKTFSVTSGTTYTVSTFIKKAERAYALIALTTGFPLTAIQINLTTGAVTTGTGTPLNAFSQDVGNGWFKVGFSLAANSTTTASANFYTSTDGAWANRVYLGDGYSGLYIWGAQLEAGAFATSYIPTVASQVTRAADAASMTGTNFSSWYNVAQGTMFASGPFVTPATVSSSLFSFGAGSSNLVNSFMLVAAYSATGNRARLFGYDAAGVNVVDIYPATTFTNGQFLQAAFAYAPNDNAVSVNGVAPTLDTTGQGVLQPDKLVIGAALNTTTYNRNGTIKRIAYYPIRLSNTELQGLTA